jgi:serine/threonine protein kinase
MAREPERPANLPEEKTAFLFAAQDESPTRIDTKALPKTESAAGQDAPAPSQPDPPQTQAMIGAAASLTESDPGETRIMTDPASAPAHPVINRPAYQSAGFSERPPVSGPGGWETMNPTGELQPGQVIFGRYTVVRRLGRGGMGTVWLCRHQVLDVEHAIKMIVSAIAFDPEARARFQREAQVTAKFTHPNAVTVHDARLASDVAFIDMEYIPGKSLDKIVERGMPMPLDWTARILEQLCDVLQVAHDKRIVHRDLKPSNLMLLDGRPPGKEHLKVLDFGIAKIMGREDVEGEFRTMPGSFMGTPPYMSPEQAEGHVDPRSDLYSVGVMLYEFLTGFRPFSGPPAVVVSDTLRTPPPPFHKINPAAQVPPAVEKVVLRCLAKKPQDRPQSARELAEEFRQALPEGVWVLPRKHNRRGWLVAAGSVLGLSLIGGAIATRGMGLWEPRKTEGGTSSSSGGSGTSKADVSTRSPNTLPTGFSAEKGSELINGWPRFIVSAKDGSRFVRVEGGSFSMGGIGGAEGRNVPPASDQVVPDLYVQETEVTNGQFERFLAVKQRAAPTTWENGFSTLRTKAPKAASRHPAVGISHSLAQAYADWLGGELPTEAEWEYIARSRGEKDRAHIWKTGDSIKKNDARANIDSIDSQDTYTIEVKTRPQDQTDQGVFDLTGNVREWCRDVSQRARSGTGDVSRFVVRGGSFESIAEKFSTTQSEDLGENEEVYDVGFRVVLETPATGDAKKNNGRGPK